MRFAREISGRQQPKNLDLMFPDRRFDNRRLLDTVAWVESFGKLHHETRPAGRVRVER